MGEVPFIPFENKKYLAWDTYHSLFCSIGGMMDVAQELYNHSGHPVYRFKLGTTDGDDIRIHIYPQFARVSRLLRQGAEKLYWGIDMGAGTNGGILRTCTWVVPSLPYVNQGYRLYAAHLICSSAIGSTWEVSTYRDRMVGMDQKNPIETLTDPCRWGEITRLFWDADTCRNLTADRAHIPPCQSPLFTRPAHGFGYVSNYYYSSPVFLPELS